MKKLAVLLIQLCMASSLLANEPMTARIINGQPATSNYDFFASIMTEFSFNGGSHWNPVCGASYIGDGLVLTAAHCVYAVNSQGANVLAVGREIRILIGDYSSNMESEYCSDLDPETPSQNCTTRTDKNQCVAGYHYTGWIAYTGNLNNSFSVTISASNTIVHEDYNPATLSNDIALIRLPNVPSNTPVNLPVVDEFQTIARSREKVRVLGHGDVISDTDLNTSEQSQALLQVDVTARTQTTCQSYLNTKAGMICAGDPGKDSCQGDSGGPLISTGATPYSLLGIVSSGPLQCGSTAPNAYGIYTDVYHYLTWINSARTSQSFNIPRGAAIEPEKLERIMTPRAAITDACTGRNIADEIPWGVNNNGDIIRLNNQSASVGAMPLSLLASLLCLLFIKRKSYEP